MKGRVGVCNTEDAKMRPAFAETVACDSSLEVPATRAPVQSIRSTARSGVICRFEISVKCKLVYGVVPGQRVSFNTSLNGEPVRRIGVVVGLREDLLWRIDEKDGVCAPFFSCNDRASFFSKYQAELLNCVLLQSRTT